MSKLQMIATCPMGLESIVAREIKQLGYDDLMTENGRVTFSGSPQDVCRANIWLRTADRILIKMGEFKATTFDELFEGTKALPWADWIPKHGEFPVQGRSHKSQLSSVPACQGIVKKAIVDKLSQTYHTDWFEETGPLYTIEVSLLKDTATITLDTTGPSLHKRGYRTHITEAPLKETMAAALIQLTRWRAERPLLDPFCGSGTLPIEAAMIGWNVAPGLRRSFPSEAWGIIGEKAWNEVRDEAYDAFDDSIDLEIYGSDIDPEAIEVAQHNAKKAGFHKDIKFKVCPVAKAVPVGDYGCLITNPPYGERLSDDKEVETLIRQLVSTAHKNDTWSTFVLNPNRNVEHYFQRKADKKRKLYNGRIETHFYQYFGPLMPKEMLRNTKDQDED